MDRKFRVYNRILSAVLAFVMFLGAFPLPVFSEDNVQEPQVTETPVQQPVVEMTVDGPCITLDGEKTDFLELRSYEKLEILAQSDEDADQYQWQILHPKKDDLWINISNANYADISVTMALVGNMLNKENEAQLRCRLLVEEEEEYTDPITVQFVEEDHSLTVLEETVPVLETPEETEPATEATEAPAETEPVTEATEAPEETEPATEATEAPAETEPATEATEAPAETEPATEATEAPAETEPATEAAESVAETEPVAEESQPAVTVEESPEETLPAVPETEPTAAEIPAAEVSAAPETVQVSEENVTLLADGDDTDSDFVTVTIEYMRYDIKWEDGKMVVDDKGNPVLEATGVQAFTPYIATLQKGTDLNTSVHNPSMIGYNTYLEDATETCTEVVINETNITENKVYTVKYKPAQVNYSVRYYFQNIYDDLYAENPDLQPTFNALGYTGATPPADILRAEVPGFTALYYQPDSIAADGSTVFEVYYERNYYLMEFDCDGGYGAETLYNRFGSYVSVPTPVRPGYTFAGWDLVESDHPDFVHDDNVEPHDDYMPAYHTAYKAVWTTSATTYTVVYWRENADDDGYSYWGSTQKNATSAAPVSGSDDIPTSITNVTINGKTVNEKNFFTYNPLLTDKNVIVEGDGSTVVNVYYSRNYYTLNFKGYGTCAMTPHDHDTDSENCQYQLLCGQSKHIHSTDCVSTLICDIPEHTAHKAECFICTKEEHTHSDTCLQCGKTEHTHTEDCCTVDEHTHTRDCYTLSEGSLENAVTDNYIVNQLNNRTPEQNGIVRYSLYGYTYYYFKIGNSWYQITGLSGDRWRDNYYQNVTISDCGKSEHDHTSGCQYCSQEEHTHVKSCYCNTAEHTHGESCYKDVVHTHTDDCYSWSCGASAHTHTEDCYGDCILPEHTHTSNNPNCNANNSSNIIYTITAKYEQNISSIWPTYDKLAEAGSHAYKDSSGNVENSGGNRFRGWDIDGVSSEAVSKRVTMTADLCDTTDGVKNAVAQYSTQYYVHLYYMFESFDQTSPANGNERRLYGGKYYDKAPAYYQDVYANDSSFGQKEITGVIAAGTQNERVGGNGSSEYNNFLYYTRERVDLKFYNVNTTVKTVTDLMYEYPLKDISMDDDPASAYVPPYPSTYEPNAYEFGGWYTTPDCFPGTEVNWTEGKMPDTDLEVYAKWTPIVRTVTFYSAYSDIEADKKDETNKQYYFMKADNVPHGSNLGSTYYDIPEWPGDLDREPTGGVEADKYDFIGWFYLDEDNKKKFAPDSMEVIRDLVLFAEWSTSIDTTYEVKYVLKDAVTGEGIPNYDAGTEIADMDSGHSSVGKTKTFTAKGLGDLYPNFQTKFFPTVNSHSILMEVQDEGQTKNKFEFEYVYEEAVYYKVRYVDAATQKELAKPTIKSTEEAVITVKFLPIKDYLPRSFYIRKALAADGAATENSVIPENVITFYYVRDTEHGSYSIEYYRENVDSQYDPKHADAAKPEYFSQYFTQYESIVGTEDLEKTVSAEVRTYQGYTHLPTLNTVITYRDNGDVNQTTIGEGLSGTIDYTGLTIKVYYTRDKYPYVVKYLESGTDKLLYEAERGEARFDADIKRTAPAQYEYDNETPGDASDDITYEYYLPNPTEADLTKKMTIREATSDAPNTMVFYYTQKKVEVQYHAVCQYENLPVGVEFGAVSINAESATAATGLAGSTATPAEAFKYVGWFKDEDCTEPVDPTWIQEAEKTAHMKPQVLTQDEDWINHYYALFEPVPLNITYDEQGGDDVPDDTALIGETITLPTTTRTDYTLTGWWYDANNNGKVDDGEKYAPGSEFTMPGKNVEFVAQWIDSLMDNRHGVFVGLNMSFYKEGDQYYYKFPPGEPTVVTLEAARAYISSIDAEGKNFWTVQEGYWDKALCKPGNVNVPAEPEDYIDPAIMDQITKNGDVIGVFDGKGVKTKALLSFTENDYKAIVKAWLNARTYFETHFASYNINWEKLPKDETLYEAVPYVIKRHYHGLTDRPDWFIDFVILPKYRFKVTYDLNLPTGFTATEPKDENLYGEGMYVNVADFHDVSNGLYVAKFLGWTAENDTTKTEIPIEDEHERFTMPGSNVTLKGRWEVRAPLTITQEGMQENETAIYRVTGDGVDLMVAITGNNTETIVGLPLGEYTVTEITGWTWKHDAADDPTVTITEPAMEGQDPSKVTLAQTGPISNVKFTFSDTTSDWLHSESAAKENQFNLS